MIKFVEQADILAETARKVANNLVKDWGGEITIEYGYDDELVVPCFDEYNGRMFNVDVDTIKVDSIVGTDNDSGDEVEVFFAEYVDGTIFYIADYVQNFIDKHKND